MKKHYLEEVAMDAYDDGCSCCIMRFYHLIILPLTKFSLYCQLLLYRTGWDCDLESGISEYHTVQSIL